MGLSRDVAVAGLQTELASIAAARARDAARAKKADGNPLRAEVEQAGPLGREREQPRDLAECEVLQQRPREWVFFREPGRPTSSYRFPFGQPLLPVWPASRSHLANGGPAYGARRPGTVGSMSDEFDLAIVDRLLTTTRSVRRRLDLDRPVAPALLDECLTIALQAPNGSGREPWRWIVVTDAGQRGRLGELYARSSAEYLASLRASDPDLDESSPTMVSSRTLWEHLGDVPVLVVPCVQLEPWHRTSPQRAYVEPSVWGSIFPAIWSFELACRSRGLGTCLVTSLLKYDAEVRAVLGVPDDVAIAGVVAVAHTSGTFHTARRRPLDEVRRFDRW